MKCKCLGIIGLLTTLSGSAQSVEAAMSLIQQYSHSHEPRVRTVAFKMMVKKQQFV